MKYDEKVLKEIWQEWQKTEEFEMIINGSINEVDRIVQDWTKRVWNKTHDETKEITNYLIVKTYSY